MKVSEIITERQQLDEVAPLAIAGATFAWTSVVTAITTLLSGYSAYQLYDLLDNNKFDMETMTDDDWFTVFVIALGIASPLIGKLGIKAASYIPTSAKVKGIQLVKKLFNKKLTPSEYRKIKLAASKNTGIPPIARIRPQQLGELAKVDRAAKVRAALKIGSIKKTAAAWKIIVLAGLVDACTDYWTQLSYLEEQYNLELNAPGTSKVFAFANGDKERAAAEFRALADAALGELTAKVSLVIVPGLGAKVFKLISIVPGFGLVGRLAAGALSLASTTTIGKGVRVGIYAWLETDAGKEFLKNSLVAVILSFTGAAARKTLEAAARLLQSYEGWGQTAVNAVGSGLGAGVAAGVKGHISPTEPAQQDAARNKIEAELNQPNTPSDLRVYIDGKTVKIGGMAVTDSNGVLDQLMGDYIRRIARYSEYSNVPNPIERLKSMGVIKVTAS